MDASDMASMMSGMSDMSGMGMDSGSGGVFVAHNQDIARTYWYIIAAFVGCACLLKVIRVLDYANRSVDSAFMSQR